MQSGSGKTRLAVLATGCPRRDQLVFLCRSTLPDVQVEPIRDLVDLMIRVAAGLADVAIVDGTAPSCLPEDGATVLKGLHPAMIVAVVDQDPAAVTPHCVDVLLDQARLPAWLAQMFVKAT
jgi:hypothetical protein